ncbi:seminal metalloprotease 1-like [Drosophila nasuta]|uniref:seminal metalloprotease 1-like n=1 Tax=Drosophila nasuta TaxID=42062 RepID=UPI00295F3A8B|nr:seminal metalloprotease 1-like [Drosophila nasuta]
MFSPRSKFVILWLACLCLGASTAPLSMTMEETDPELTADYFQGDMEIEVLRNGELSPTLHWPNATVYYKISGEFDAEHAVHIELGMRLIERASCIRFLPATVDTLNYVSVITSDSGCSSKVGYKGGEQTVKLKIAPIDLGCFKLGTIQHEFLHTLGFHHQQCSPNRDEFVKVIEENITEGRENNFKKYTEDRVGDFDVPYDYSSILHYSSLAFSKNGEATIIALDPEGQAKMGQRIALSDGDIIRLNTMYKCPLQM